MQQLLLHSKVLFKILYIEHEEMHFVKHFKNSPNGVPAFIASPKRS
jgi:hypothetical protein